MKQKRFARLAWGVLGWNLLVILWGALVRATGSGAGCGGHWPSCHGQIIPQFSQTATVFEFTHRILSGLAMILVLILLLWGRRVFPRGHHVRIGLTASAAFILLEALLGAGLVLFELTAQNQSVARAIAMAVHLANTFLLIGSLALTAFWASGVGRARLKGQRYLPFLLIGLLGVILIGMSGAVTALGDTLFPAGSLAEGLAADADPNAHFLIRLRVFHPLIAVAVAVYSLYLMNTIRQKQTGLPRRLALAVMTLVLTQLAAGLVNLLLLAPIPMQLIHLFLADLVWIGYVLTSAALFAAPSVEVP